MDKKSIYLVRHGDIALGKDKRYIGQSDLPLSALGLEQAVSLKELFSRIPLDKIYCSDLERTRQTAEIVASVHSFVPIVCPDLREINMGDWEGKPFAEIKTGHPEEFKERGEKIASYRPPNGESFADCYRRIIPLFECLVHSAEDILIVGHAGVNRVILCHVLGLGLDQVFRFAQGYGCVNLISRQDFQYCLDFLNHTLNQTLKRSNF